jgi:hypothetical protein
MVFYHTRGQGSKNLKGGTGNNFDCLSGTEKKVRKLRHFANKMHRWRYFYNNKKGRVNRDILPKKCINVVKKYLAK